MSKLLYARVIRPVAVTKMTNVFTELLIISPKSGSLNQKDLFIICYPVRYLRYLVVDVLIFR